MNSLTSVPLQAALGESPVWCSSSQTLWMVDIRAPAVLQFNPDNKTFRRFDMPDLTGMVALATSGLIAGVGRLVQQLDPVSGALGQVLIELDSEYPDNRINDSKVGPDQALWCGTMARSNPTTSGSLFHYSSDGALLTLRKQIAIPNALCFSPDAQTVYFADTKQGEILQAPWNRDATPNDPMEFAPFAAANIAPGSPDGSCMDADGYIWNARYGGSCVVRINPQGTLDRVIELPAKQPTCCALGGPNLKTLFITTAQQNLEPPADGSPTLDGDLFMIDVDVAGLPEPIFKG